MERSVIRGLVLGAQTPDYAALHPGYKIMRCPTGKTSQPSVNRHSPKYSPLQNF